MTLDNKYNELLGDYDFKHCPNCNSIDVIPIIYGYGSDQLFQKAEEGKIKLGSCIIRDGQPLAHCKNCNNEWNEANIWYMKGTSFYNTGKYDEANECFYKAVRINPEYAEAWNSMGNVLFVLEKFIEAVQFYDTAIRMNPEYVNAWHNKGSALYKIGKLDDSTKCFNEAIRINPEYAKSLSNNKNVHDIVL